MCIWVCVRVYIQSFELTIARSEKAREGGTRKQIGGERGEREGGSYSSSSVLCEAAADWR